MKKSILTLAILALAMTAGLMAQSTTSTSTLPPSQQVDQSGKPETGSGPDVDVDTGNNAKNGVLNVDVDRKTDSDTAAQGDSRTNLNNNSQNPVEQGTTATGNAVRRTTGTTDTTTTTTDATTTGGTYNNDTDTSADQGNLPSTASEMPLLGLLGLLALAGAFVIRATR